MDRGIWLPGILAGVFVLTSAQDISRSSPLFFPDGETPAFHSYSSLPKSDQKSMEESEWRLPRNIVPVRYNLTMNVDPTKDSFSGSVQIFFYCVKETRKVSFHALNLDLEHDFTKVYDVFNESQVFEGILKEDHEHQTMALNLDHEIQQGHSYRLEIRFRGSYADGFRGLYRSNYTQQGETKWLAVTHFEPTNARRMFPCFDEPNMKAYFNVTVIHPQEYTALSNTPLRSKEVLRYLHLKVPKSQNLAKVSAVAILSTSDYSVGPTSNQTVSSFEETVKMSTYLLAIVVSEYQNFSNGNNRANVWARPDLIPGAKFSQELAADALNRLENYTHIRFAMEKIDHVAVPHFAAGAMENYGLITYKEPYLSLEENKTNTPTKVYTVTVIAHELAHQWFGNLVTLDWWSYTWLNEAFATFVAYHLPGEDESWRLREQFIPAKFQAGMEMDQDPEKSIPMTSSVEKPDDISSKFDPISYSKGAAVLRMFENLLEEKPFQEALKNYLIKRASNNALPEELFEEFQKVSNKSSRQLPEGLNWIQLGESWTAQAGLPLVTITRDYANGKVSFTQSRLCSGKNADKCKQERWWIPIIWTFQEDTELEKRDVLWLSRSPEVPSVTIETKVGKEKWILGNVKSIGYYRVNYDSENWRLLAENLRKNPLDFPTENRAQILHDVLHLALANENFMSQALNVTMFLQNEEDAIVWMAGVKVLRSIYDVVAPTDIYDDFEKVAQNLLTKVYSKKGINYKQDGEGKDGDLIRAYVTPYACMFAVEKCLKDARLMIGKILDGSGVHPDVETAVICGGLKAGDENLFWEVRAKALEPNNATINDVLLAALSCSKDEGRIKEHLRRAVTEESFPITKLPLALESVVKSVRTFDIGFNFISKNLKPISEKLGEDATTNLLKVLCSTVRTRSQYQSVDTMLESNKYNIKDVETLKKVLKSRSNQVEQNKLLSHKIADWLKKQPDSPGNPGDNVNSDGRTSTVEPKIAILLLSLFLAITGSFFGE